MTLTKNRTMPKYVSVCFREMNIPSYNRRQLDVSIFKTPNISQRWQCRELIPPRGTVMQIEKSLINDCLRI